MDVREDLMSAFNGEDDTQPFDSQPNYEDSQAIDVPLDYGEDSQYDGPSPRPLKRLKASEELGGEATAMVEATPVAQPPVASRWSASAGEMVADAGQVQLMAAQVEQMVANPVQPQVMAAVADAGQPQVEQTVANAGHPQVMAAVADAGQPEIMRAQVEQMVADAAQPAPVQGEDAARRILEKKRATSRAWHAKWVSKGVLRSAPAAPPLGQDGGPVPVAGQDGGPVPVAGQDGGPVPVAGQAVNPGRPLNKRDHCARFVTRWLSESNLPPSNERRMLAYKAWMESSERAALMAGQAGVQG